MKQYLAYCRVSTKAQADKDNSLPAQKRIIGEYADRKGFEIVKWYSEAKSGYKGNREEFNKLLEHLKASEIEGVIFHKLDRSSRNVGDFALLDKLVTQNKKRMVVIEGEFDTSRAAGRLAFRNFCNMAVWYSENLSEEVTTKMTEVLRKGYYPTQTPIGYRTGTKNDPDPKKKYPDPILAPHVKEAFKLYATGEYSLQTICEYMRGRGMTNSHGGMLRKGIFERLLKNPFYHGLIEWCKGSERETVYYEGNHEPLISKKLFDQVQAVFEGRQFKNKKTHDYTYMQMIKCECGRWLISGQHKGHIYLECHSKECNFTSIREDRLEDQIILNLGQFVLADEFLDYSKLAIKELSGNIREDNKARRKSLNMKLAQLDGRLQKINNAVIEGFFDAEEGIAEKNKIVKEKHNLMEKLSEAEEKKESLLWDLTIKMIMGFNYLPYSFRKFNSVAKRRILKFLFLNLQLNGKRLGVQAVPEFEKVKLANYWLLSEKLRLNHRPNAGKPLKEAFPMVEEAAFCTNLHNGGLTGTRTQDQKLKRLLLYQLSYQPKILEYLVSLYSSSYRI